MVGNRLEDLDVARICRQEHALQPQLRSSKQSPAAQPQAFDVAVRQIAWDGGQDLDGQL